MPKKIIKLKELPISNKHLPEPFKVGEKFILIVSKSLRKENNPDSFVNQFYKVLRVSNKKKYTMFKKYFK